MSVSASLGSDQLYPEHDMLINLMNPKAAKDLVSLPSVIAKFEHDYKQYEKRTGEQFPEKFKIPALIQMLPN